jgi:hypothetical protein
MALFRRFQLGFPIPNVAVYGLTQVTAGRWLVQADETSMRAMAGISAETQQPLRRHG